MSTNKGSNKNQQNEQPNPYPQLSNDQPPYPQQPYQQQLYPQQPYQQQPYPQQPYQQQPYQQQPYPQQPYPYQPQQNPQQPYGQQTYPYPNPSQPYVQPPNTQQAQGQSQNTQQPPNGQQTQGQQLPNPQQPQRQPSYPNPYPPQTYGQNPYPQQPYGQQQANSQYPLQALGQQASPNTQPSSQTHYPTSQNQPSAAQYSKTMSIQNSMPVQPNLPPLDQKKVDADAAALRKAMKGFGTDEKAIIEIAANSTFRERLAMIESFKRQFKRDLIKDLKSELSGHFEDTILALFKDPIEYDCYSLKKAMKGLGTNEDTLIEILATRPNYYINQIKQKYRTMYGKTLEEELASELSGDLKKVMMTLASAFRSENTNADITDCTNKADQLYKAWEKRWGTDEKVFYDILTKASPEEIKMINKIYYQKHNHGLLKAIDKEFSGDMKKLLKTVVHVSLDPSEYFATRVNYAIKGIGTKDTLLIRILVTRDEMDMPKIREAYKRLYNKDMIKDIEDDTSGDYKKILVELASH